MNARVFDVSILNLFKIPVSKFMLLYLRSWNLRLETLELYKLNYVPTASPTI